MPAVLRRLLHAVVGPDGALAEKGATVREICWDAVWIAPVALSNVALDDLLRLLHPTGFGLVVCWTCQLAFLIGTLGKYALHVVGDWRSIHRDRGRRSR